MPVVATITAAASAGAAIGGAISGVVDTNRRRIYEHNLAFLDAQQKEALNKRLLEQNTEDAKQKILADILGSVNKAKIDALVQSQNEKEKTQRYVIIAAIFGGVILLATTLYLIKSK